MDDLIKITRKIITENCPMQIRGHILKPIHQSKFYAITLVL